MTSLLYMSLYRYAYNFFALSKLRPGQVAFSGGQPAGYEQPNFLPGNLAVRSVAEQTQQLSGKLISSLEEARSNFRPASSTDPAAIAAVALRKSKNDSVRNKFRMMHEGRAEEVENLVDSTLNAQDHSECMARKLKEDKALLEEDKEELQKSLEETEETTQQLQISTLCCLCETSKVSVARGAKYQV